MRVVATSVCTKYDLPHLNGHTAVYISQPLWRMSLGNGSKCTPIPCESFSETHHHRKKLGVTERCEQLALRQTPTHTQTLYLIPSSDPRWGFQGPWEWINIWGKVSTALLYLLQCTFFMLPHTGWPLYFSFSGEAPQTRNSFNWLLKVHWLSHTELKIRKTNERLFCAC